MAGMQMSWLLAGEGQEHTGGVWDRALRFGMSVFETIAVVAGRVLFYRDHLDRLAAAAGDLFEVEVPVFACDPARELAATNLTGILRIYVSAGPGGLLDPVTHARAFALFETCTVEAGPGSGLRVLCERAPVLPPPGGWKTGNYWQNVRARQKAAQAGCGEALVATPSGAVTGAAMGNVFAVVDGRLVTPSLETGARNGVVRSWILGRIPCAEEWLTFEDFRRAQEIFVTNSRVGVAWVAELDGRPLAGSAIAGDLSVQYRNEVLQP